MRTTALAVAVAAILAGCGGTEADEVEATPQAITCAIYEAAPDKLLCICTDEAGALAAFPPPSNCVPPLLP